MSTKTPIQRPMVTIYQEIIVSAEGEPALMHRVICAHCPTWAYGPTAAKSDAEWHARRHRAAHRKGEA
jgi:hypothetical protein